MTYEGKIYPREDIKVTKCGLNIPQEANNYKDFINKFKVFINFCIKNAASFCIMDGCVVLFVI